MIDYDESRCHRLACLVMDADSVLELKAMAVVFSQAYSNRMNMVKED